jgi:hypothetical protein
MVHKAGISLNFNFPTFEWMHKFFIYGVGLFIKLKSVNEIYLPYCKWLAKDVKVYVFSFQDSLGLDPLAAYRISNIGAFHEC